MWQKKGLSLILSFYPLTQNDGDTIFLLFSELKAERISSCLGKGVRQMFLEEIKYA